eukprot:Em1216g1a
MDSLLQGIKQVCTYIDDILVTGENESEHLKNLDEVLKRLKEAGVTLIRFECYFLQPEVEYLGHKISKAGLSPTDAKPQQVAFEKAKKLLTSSKILAHYDSSNKRTCDASPYGVGAVLSHRDADGTEQPIAFVSRALATAERNYSQLDKEGLDILFAVKRFHSYLMGRSFVICSDHKPLLHLFGEKQGIPAMASARLQRWALILSAYQYTIEYKAGKQNANADSLSRLPLPDIPVDVPVPEETVFLKDTLQDPVSVAQI